jgi:hypothetical protein
MSVTTCVPSCGEGCAQGGVLFVERVMARHQRQHAAGLERLQRLGEEEVVQRQALAAVGELDVGEGHVADRRVDAVLGQDGIAEILDADVVRRVEGPGDAPGERVELDADEAHALRRVRDEITGAAAGLQHGGFWGDAQVLKRRVHGPDHQGRGVKRREGGALGAVVFFRAQQGLQFLAEPPPGVVAIAAADGIGKEKQRHRAEAGEALQRLPFFRRGGTLLPLYALQCADRRENIAGFGFEAAGAGRSVPLGMDGGKGQGRCCNGCHGNLLCLWFLVSRRTRLLAGAKGSVVIRNPAGEAGGCGQRIDNAPGAGRVASACGDGERKERFLDGRGRRGARARR